MLPAGAPGVALPFAPMHGLGGAKDLPVPAPLAIAGGTAALIVSFCVLILAWRNPRYDPPRAGRPVPAGLARVLDSAGYRTVLRVLGLVFTAYVVWPLVAGPDLATNPALGVFYVVLWVGIVPSSLAFGRFYRAVSPVRTLNLLLARATGGDPARGLTPYPERLGYWPAAATLFAFVWQELVNPNAAFLDSVRLWLVGYLAIMLVGSAVFGDIWLSRADPFEVYSDLLARLSPWARGDDGRLVWLSPLAHLARTPAVPGLVGVVAVLFGSTAFDSYKDTLPWLRFVKGVGGNPEVVNGLGLLGFCLVVAVTFSIATMSTGVETEGPDALDRRTLPRLLAHSVLPIVVGYMTAHYLSYFVEQGQVTLRQLSDPMVSGHNYLGTANLPLDYWLSLHPRFLATVKVLAVVTGHVIGVVAAHDRAIALLPKRHQVTGQLGLLVVMVAYTGTGLYLLFGA